MTTSDLRVNIAVCGKFHMHNHVRYIDQAGALNCFYYAARRSTDATELGIAPDRAVNAWLKEYLVHGHGRLLGHRGASLGFPLYANWWEQSVLLRWRPAPMLHFLLHGTCLRLVRRARAEGARIIGEPVNSHPQLFVQLVNEEHQRLGISTDSLKLGYFHRRMIDEAAGCDWLLAGSEFVRRSYVEQGFDPKRFYVIPYGVDLRQFNPLTDEERCRERSAGDQKFRVICVAQITPRKGHIYLLEAWKRLALPARETELLFIGSMHRAMRPMLARYDGLFRYIPRVPHSELREYYARSSLFVLPSVEDGFAYVVAEAMACGLPVITTVNTGAAVLVTEPRDGFVVPIRSPEAIAEKIELLYRNRQLLAQMSEEAAATSRRDRSWQRYADHLLDFYRRLPSA